MPRSPKAEKNYNKIAKTAKKWQRQQDISSFFQILYSQTSNLHQPEHQIHQPGNFASQTPEPESQRETEHQARKEYGAVH